MPSVFHLYFKPVYPLNMMCDFMLKSVGKCKTHTNKNRYIL